MISFQNFQKPDRKYFLNLIYFFLSIVIVTAIWPYGPDVNLIRVIGTLILISCCYLVLWLFLSHFRSEVLGVTRKTLFIILTILSFILLTRFIMSHFRADFLLLIPFVIIPVVIRTFYDARLALFILLISIMITGFMVPDPFTFIFINFITGMVAIFTLTNIYRKGKLFMTAAAVILSYSVLYTGLHLMRDGSLINIRLSDFYLFAGNGILVLIGYPIIFIFFFQIQPFLNWQI